MTTTDAVEAVPEAVTGELVHRPQTSSESAIERAAEYAISTPGVPGRDEFLALAAQARILSMSGGAPKPVQGNPHLAFHLTLIGRDLNLSPSAALRMIDVIEVKRGSGEYQLSLSPELINGVLVRDGYGRIVPVYEGVDRCVALALGPGGQDRRCRRRWPDHVDDCLCDDLGEVEFTWEDARMAGLVGEKCQPGAHEKVQRSRNDGSSYSSCGCNQGYITYPKTMLWWRTAAFAARRYFPQSTLGMYTSEELGATLDTDGKMLNPATAELPEGYGPPPPPPPPPQADTDELWSLQERIHALPAEQQAEMRDRWGKSTRLKGRRVSSLPADLVNLATSMIAGFESVAKRDGYDVDAARADVRARCAAAAVTAVTLGWFRWAEPVEPPAADEHAPEAVGEPEAATGPETAPDATTAQETADDGDAAADQLALERSVAEQADPALIERVAAAVKKMGGPAVDAELVGHGLQPVGNVEARQMRLAVRRVYEAVELAHDTGDDIDAGGDAEA